MFQAKNVDNPSLTRPMVNEDDTPLPVAPDLVPHFCLGILFAAVFVDRDVLEVVIRRVQIGEEV